MGIFGFGKKADNNPPLMLQNTLSRKLEVFEPRDPKAVTIYSCGPTVYDYVHIGNMRSYVFSDILKRTLLRNGFEVKHTINLTDFGHLSGDGDDGEDKMVSALRREGKPMTLEAMREVADRYIHVFEADMAALRIMPPMIYARASDYIKEEIALVKVLTEKGYTYETSDGVYFDVSRFPDYGKLGNINLAALKEGARVEANPEKKHPADFAIWKKGELGWESPWGKGFPGWHIECTAMIFATLGKQIDIHTGGIDHIATHHNGEIAQAEAATGKSPYVRYWMHNAFITLEQKRIGKSVGNAINLRQIVERGFSPIVYRYWLLTGRYSSPMDFTFEALEGAKQAHFKLRKFVYGDLHGVEAGTPVPEYMRRFLEALNDDLDTPSAIALLWEVVKDKTTSARDILATIRSFDEVLELGLSDEKDDDVKALEVISIDALPEDVRALITERDHARKEKRWADADSLREAINLKGYLVEDSAKGTQVTKAQ